MVNMISLINLLKEHSGEAKPYMYSPVGFSCNVCSYLNYDEESGNYKCGSTEYQEHMGTELLVKEDGVTPLAKEDLQYYCSNWFEPKGELSEKKKKIKKAYLTKDATAMKKEIDRVSKLSSDDPSAYNKWDADYADKGKTKKYKTKKSVATSAYEKRFGKKKVSEEKSNEKEMIDGIVEMLKQVKDIGNRKKIALDRLKDFEKEGIKVDEKEFLKKCGLQ